MAGSSCRTEDVERALSSLDGAPIRIQARDWPGDLIALDEAGLYSWWIDEEGAQGLEAGLGLGVNAGRIYAGQTGATRWPSGSPSNETLSGRIGSLHLNGNVRGSTFRLTLAAILREPLGITVSGPRKLGPGSESALSTWIAHLEVACFPYPDRDALDDLETRVLHQLDPPLNLAKMPPTPIRIRLKELRRHIANPVEGERLPRHAAGTTRTKRRASTPSRTTLHDELVAIMRLSGGRWYTTQELADTVNTRGNYAKRDGSAVTSFQIHGRTKNYPHLFEREGPRVRLRPDSA